MFKMLRKMIGREDRTLFKRTSMVMVDLETLDTENTAAFYAIGARRYVSGEFVHMSLLDPVKQLGNQVHDEFLIYISPSEFDDKPEFTKSENTIKWTMEKNLVEYDRAVRLGVSIERALTEFTEWLERGQDRYMASNSPIFDHAILRHAYTVMRQGPFPMHFRTDFDVRTIGHLRHEVGLPRYMPIKDNRLHSPLDDCTVQINAQADFIQHLEKRMR